MKEKNFYIAITFFLSMVLDISELITDSRVSVSRICNEWREDERAEFHRQISEAERDARIMVGRICQGLYREPIYNH